MRSSKQRSARSWTPGQVAEGMDVFVEVMNAAEARPKVIAILEKLGLTSRAKVSVADTQGLGAATGTYQAQDWTNTVGLLDDQELHVRRNASLEAEDSHAFPYTILVSLNLSRRRSNWPTLQSRRAGSPR